MPTRTCNNALLVGAALLVGCLDPPPTAEDVARWSPEFYFPLPLTGLHYDSDTGVSIFRYSVAPHDRYKLLQRIRASAQADGWKVVHEGQSGGVGSLHLQRIDDPRSRYRDYHSLEIVRITSCDSTILIAAMQEDIWEESRLAENAANGGRWYRKYFWPRVARYRAEACGTQ
jgi:hypothetical protein